LGLLLYSELSNWFGPGQNFLLLSFHLTIVQSKYQRIKCSWGWRK